MRIAYVAAGAAGMYCGSCLHDNTLAAALLERGHDVTLIPTYTPLRTDEADVSIDRVFYGALNAFLAQKVPVFARAPRFVHRLLDRPRLLGWVSRVGASTDASELGALTLSVLEGEAGRQRRELDELVDWLVELAPEVVHLTNSMFLGLAGPIRRRVGAPVVCGLSGEDLFLDALVEPWRSRVLAELARRAGDADAFLAPNRYFAGVMARRLGVAEERVHVVPLGIRASDLAPGDEASGRAAGEARPVTIGYLARICREKGADLLCDAFRRLAPTVPGPGVRLRLAGWVGPGERELVADLERRIRSAGLQDRFEVLGEVDRAGKRRLLADIDVLSVPTRYRESKGLYVLEALAAGVPVVVPDHGAFPELIAQTGGGVLCAPGSPESLAAALAALVGDAERRAELGERGRRAVEEGFTADAMARRTETLYRRLVGGGVEGAAARRTGVA